MSTFKRLNRQDFFIAPYTAKKSWVSKQSEFDEYKISKDKIISGSVYDLVSGSTENYFNRLKYKSIKHLYYSNFSGSLITGSYENYIASSLESGSRNLEEYATVFSYSREITGEGIDPTTFTLTFVSGSTSGSVQDNGEGKLLLVNTNLVESEGKFVGDIIYPHGLCIVTDTSISDLLESTSNYTSSWDSNFTLYTMNIYCRVQDYELNTSQNPRILTGSVGTVKNFATGSDFRPYITGIGLYNPANELIAVGKFGQPIPKLPYTDMVFVLKMDM